MYLLNSFYCHLFNPSDIEATSKFALMEFKYGEPERGRSLFESILSSHPKRSDIWSMFIDQELKLNNTVAIRYL